MLDITSFNTTLGHPDLSQVVIPNRKIVGEILHNYGKIRQLASRSACPTTPIRAPPSSSSAKSCADPRVLKDPAPVIRIDRLADSCVVIGVMPWVEAPHYVAAVGDVNQAILRGLPRARHRHPVPAARDPRAFMDCQAAADGLRAGRRLGPEAAR